MTNAIAPTAAAIKPMSVHPSSVMHRNVTGSDATRKEPLC